jgi:conjugal transfer pilus assembly protein TraF
MSARNVRLHLVLVALSAVAALAPATTATAQVAAGAERRETPPRTFWLDRWRGWHFYEDPPPDEVDKRRPTKPVPTPADAAAARAPELAEFERLQKTLEEFRNVAIVRPTEANVRRYMELEALVVGRASYFAGVAQRVAWSTPELDPTVQGRPVNAKALEVFERPSAAPTAQPR